VPFRVGASCGLLAVLFVAGCRGSTYACPAPTDCAALAAAREGAQEEYLARVGAGRYDDAEDVGVCSQALTQDAFAMCHLDACTEICLLHPSGEPVEDCAPRCQSAALEHDVALLRILDAAAYRPGLPTCDICYPEARDFCTAVFGCLYS
jgi:hypothetical protein